MWQSILQLSADGSVITRASAGSVTTAWVLYVAVGLASGAAFTYVTSSHREAGYREALANIGRVMSSSLDMAGVIDHFAENLRTIIPFDQLAVSTVDTRQGITSPSYVAGANKTDSNDIGNPVPLQGSLAGVVVRKRARPTGKVLHMSGYLDSMISKQGDTLLDGGFLQKPVTMVKLARKVREMLDL